jgi:gluconokinase
LHTPVILAIDIGSSSVRAALYDYDARPLKGLAARREWSFNSTPDGGSEMDAEGAFAVVRDVVDNVLSRSSSRKLDITHIAMCSFWHSLVGVDARGRPTTSLLGWADTRSRKYSAELKRRFNEDEVHDRTGAHFHSSFWPAKLVWLRQERPDVFARTTKWLGFGDYVAMRLTGEPVTSVSMASATGIFDQHTCYWDKALLRCLKIRRTQMPQIATGGVSYLLTPKFKMRWPQLRSAHLFPVMGDGAADHLGSCGVGKNKASLMVGTSAAMRVAYQGAPPKRVPSGLWCYRVDDRRVIVGGALSDGGNLYEWCRRTFDLPPDVENEIRRRDPQRPLPTVHPYFHGERSTGYREDARGGIDNLLPSYDGVDVLHAAMLAVAERIAAIYKRLRQVVRIDHVTASGGALTASPLWREMIATTLGREIEVSDQGEAALRGAVLLALEHINAE